VPSGRRFPLPCRRSWVRVPSSGKDAGARRARFDDLTARRMSAVVVTVVQTAATAISLDGASCVLAARGRVRGRRRCRVRAQWRMHRTANTSAAPASTRTDGNGGRRFVLLSAASVLRRGRLQVEGPATPLVFAHAVRRDRLTVGAFPLQRSPQTSYTSIASRKPFSSISPTGEASTTSSIAANTRWLISACPVAA
jgi:hypothetical protein